jgi:hypothetical protein
VTAPFATGSVVRAESGAPGRTLRTDDQLAPGRAPTKAVERACQERSSAGSGDPGAAHEGVHVGHSAGVDVAFPEPTDPYGSRAAVFLAYVDHFREVVIDKVMSLPGGDVVRSRLPSGWSPVELLLHLRHVERRWLEWGFLGRDVGDPWADERDGRWHVSSRMSLADVIDELREQGARTRGIVESYGLDERGQPGPRWSGAEPATLERVLFHLLQEYARHLGQLDIVIELITGATSD